MRSSFFSVLLYFFLFAIHGLLMNPECTDFKKQKVAASQPVHDHEPSGLDALATAAVLGDNVLELGTSLVATTTKHPRHRPGCTCIVCIQPPSGKGPKHKPTCTCNVCMTVKRRFKTLMLRKKKRQSEKEAEVAHNKQLTWGPKDEVEVESSSRSTLFSLDVSENDGKRVNVPQSSIHMGSPSEKIETGKSPIDLNSQPDREDDPQMGSARLSMTSLLQVANLPLETYLRQHGLASLTAEQQASSSSHAPPHAAGESDKQPNDESDAIVALEREQEQDREQEQEGDSGPDEEYYEPDQCQNDLV